MNPLIVYALIAAGAYYLGRQGGAKDQADVDASKSLLGTPTKTLNAWHGTSAVPGSTGITNLLGTGTQPPAGQ